MLALATTVNASQPVEVALGMASRPAIQAAIDTLVARGVSSIVAVPLFISSHSSVVNSSAYLLGVRSEMPADLKLFAAMRHGSHRGGQEKHAGHEAAAVADHTRPVVSPVAIRITDALNHHAIVGEILLDRARAISVSAQSEAVIVVAHGPVPEDDNARLLADMNVLADQIGRVATFASVQYLTVRDDAPAAVRDAATAELRRLVTEQAVAGVVC